VKLARLTACAVITLILLPSLVYADARLVSVTPVGSGCVAGPTGPFVEAWDVERGETYVIRLEDVFECVSGGTDATLDVRVNSSNTGNIELVATNVAPGVYEFEYTVPLDGICTMPVFYCTTPGDGSSGIHAIRQDGGAFQAHLRVSTFESGCSNPSEILGGDCAPIDNDENSWSTLKTLFQ
jgi:hypothetical protein